MRAHRRGSESTTLTPTRRGRFEIRDLAVRTTGPYCGVGCGVLATPHVRATLDWFRDTSLKAEQLFEQAIKLDPNFALAFAGLSRVESWLYHQIDPAPAWREKARLHANEALRLQPDLPEGHLALGFAYSYGDRDY